MISNTYWQNQLREILSRNLSETRSSRVAVMGIGNELRGDDSAGVLIAQMLQKELGGYEDILVINAGIVPENFAGVLKRFNPRIVVMLDAAYMDKLPGEICLIDWHNVSGNSLSTHMLPLNITADFLMRELDCEVILIGVQPRWTAFGSYLSPEVRNAVAEIVSNFNGLLQSSCKNIDLKTDLHAVAT